MPTNRRAGTARRAVTSRAAARVGTAKTGRIRTTKVPTKTTKTTKSTKTGKASKSTKAAKRAGSEKSTDVLVQLPAGEAHIVIQAKAGVRKTARAWVQLVERLAQADLSPTALLAELRADLTVPAQGLTPAEQDELAAAGARPAAQARTAAGRRERVSLQLSVLTDALDVPEAARQLGVDPTRIRQRLREGSLYGLRGDGRTWRLPRWQFDADGQPIPHLRDVLAALPADLHPRSVAGFLTTPQPELIIDGEAYSPRDWLTSGGPAEPVVALAESVAAT